MNKTGLLLIIFLLLFGWQAKAQQQVTGRILDAITGEPLPAAHVIIKGTYKGTISNADGEYRIQVEESPAVLVVRFLGYESQEKAVPSNGSTRIDFHLNESVSSMGEITVTGEDPAISIMKEVIRRKQIWRESLQTYKAEAYTRQQLKNDTSIVSISESVSIAYWDKERGSREVVRSRRQTANIEAGNNFAGVRYLPNFYDDNLDIAGFDVVGITHPNALSFYTFELEDILSLDNQVVYKITVTSNRKLQPLFEGTIHVLGEEYALLEVDLKPNSVIAFPPPVQDFDLSYAQQFSNFGGDYWLPVDVRIEGLVEVGMVGLRFPPIGFKQVAKLNNYEVNIPLPDTLFNTDRSLSVDSSTINSGDSLFVHEVDVIPLDEQEESAYENLDSTATLEKAFRPTGFFTRFLDWDEESDESGTEVTISTGSDRSDKSDSTSTGKTRSSGPSLFTKLTRNLSPLARFNRVDAIFLGIQHERFYDERKYSSKLNVGYSTGYGHTFIGQGKFSYAARVGWWPSSSRRYAIYGGYEAVTETRYNSDLFDRTITSFPVLLGFNDYFDYYRKEGFYVGSAYRPNYRWGTFRLEYSYEDHSSIDYKTSYDILGSSRVQRPNPFIDEGTLSAFELTYRRGNDKKAFGAVGANDYLFGIEHSATALGSEWNFTRFKIDLYRRFETFYQRRFFPNTLDMRLNAGTYIGDLPTQRNEALDAAPGIFTPFGAFRTKRFLPYEGASYVALNAEHNFKSVPLELLGWRDATKTGLSIIAFGGIGRTWVRDEQVSNFNRIYGNRPHTTHDWHVEAGVSVSNIFNLIRADLAFRLDYPGVFFGVSIARFF